MTNLSAILTIAILVICFAILLLIFDAAVGEVMDEHKQQARAEERERKRFENTVDEISTRVQLDREQLFRDYIRSEGRE